MPELNVGDAAPDFELMDQDKEKVKLSDLKGRKVLLIFYPMDFSPTCTDEHKTFGPAIDEIKAAGDGAAVFGVNADSPFCHAAFKKARDIPYPLLSDPTREMLKAYGMFAGLEPFNCSKRGHVAIDDDGKVINWTEVKMDAQRPVSALTDALAG